MTIDECIDKLEHMLMYSDPYEVDCEALRCAIAYLQRISGNWVDIREMIR